MEKDGNFADEMKAGIMGATVEMKARTLAAAVFASCSGKNVRSFAGPNEDTYPDISKDFAAHAKIDREGASEEKQCWRKWRHWIDLEDDIASHARLESSQLVVELILWFQMASSVVDPYEHTQTKLQSSR